MIEQLKAEIEEARRQVGICQRRAAKPGSSVEDELSLQYARCWLLTLENRLLKRIAALHRKLSKQPQEVARVQDKPRTAKEAAEAAFASLTKGAA